MEYGALLLPAAEKPSSTHRLFWAGVAALCVTGVWCVSAMTSAAVQAQVQTPTAVRVTSPAFLKQMSTNTAQAAVSAEAYSVDVPVPSSPAQQSQLLQQAPALAVAFGFAAFIFGLVKQYTSRQSTETASWKMAASLGEIMGMARKADERRSPEKLGMDQVALAIKEEQARSKTMTPKEVVLELQRGNARFWSGMPERPEMNAMERRALIMAQAPMVCILSCADSRVPVEIVFDQGLGRVFVVRVAGNILDPTAMGSIEFSVKYLGVKVVLVMGHEACGAVKGAMTMSNDDIDKQPAFLQTVLRSIRNNLDLEQLKKMRDSRAQDRQAIVVNTYSQVKALQENKLIAERVANGSLMVCGAFYEITSGMVDFFTLDKNGLVVDI